MQKGECRKAQPTILYQCFPKILDGVLTDSFHFISSVCILFYFILCYFVFLPFLGLLPWHMEVPRLGV